MPRKTRLENFMIEVLRKNKLLSKVREKQKKGIRQNLK